MKFELTESLKNDIIHSLENNEKKFFVSASNGELIECGNNVCDNEYYYDLPEWNSSQGFKLRSDFVDSLRAPKVKKALKEILHSGRGVFKSFKNQLKEYPEIEKSWHQYKNKMMLRVIDLWYNDLLELWGLERMEILEDDTDGLASSDFTFTPYSLKDEEFIVKEYFKESGDFYNNCEEEIIKACNKLWHNQFMSLKDRSGFVCRTLIDDFAGCITVAPCSNETQDTVFITSFFVLQDFRGLGIGSKLLDMCISSLRAKAKWIVVSNTGLSSYVESLFLSYGFHKSGQVLIKAI